MTAPSSNASDCSQPPTQRIAKAIAASGLCSRRQAEGLIADGRVRVNGELIDSPALNVDASAEILVDDQPLPASGGVKLYCFHKPKGVLTTSYDPEDRPIIYDHLPEAMQQYHPVGRLDYHSEGLLLLTNNGELKRKLEHPNSGLKRIYRARVKSCPTRQTLKTLEEGVTIDGFAYRPITVKIQNTGSNSWLEVTLLEGKNREIRRVFDHFGHPVSRLIRTEYGPYKLGKLKAGSIEQAKLALTLPTV